MVRMIDLRSRVTGHWPFAGPVYLTHIGKPSCEGPLEEENLPHYRPELFYPVRVGATLKGRYLIVAKLGWGCHATVWYCCDKVQKRYLALKIGTAQRVASSKSAKLESPEFAAYRRLEECNIDLPSTECFLAREAAEYFTLRSCGGKFEHPCFVFPAAVADLGMLQAGLSQRCPSESVQLCKQVVKSLLTALDILHTQAGMVHCDIKPDNILFSASDESIYADVAKTMKKRALGARWSRKGRRSTWESVHLSEFVPKEFWGHPVLGDLGEARICKTEGQRFKAAEVCSVGFRPAEIICGMEWGSEVDIWGVGMVAVILLSNQLMFGFSRQNGDHAHAEYLARMQAIMSAPPKEFLDRMPRGKNYWDKNGQWTKKFGVEVPNRSIESIRWKVEEDQEPALLEFLRGIFTWLPEERKSARELLDDAWLQS
ncbi:unnamed protein product [Zymoseptoria tritici ST99CH_3D1]|uniref:Protein kinase domain-containing protein n=2 Tax=Zymoseptoria tritici TaxID=1047171 RepID=A0A1X7RIX5_ZYMT9|nr:unnamed protein product [Zymoseptoria tritici ST99CH_3D7]SMR45886.1 unnamed protein product [Zymoseptoria tritici ST99CH_1E4]SMR47135.1 unnamed protein product [Zymoseptoria tritici ST99CH_3D1]